MAEKNTSTLLILHFNQCSRRMAQWSEAALFFSLEGADSNPGVATSSFFFFSLIVFLPFGLLLFILTADLLASRDFCENVFLVSVIKKWQYGNLCHEPRIDHLLQGEAEKMRHNWAIIQSIVFFYCYL